MFSRIRRRFTYANIAMTLALVFAMSGGAYAAKHYLITSTKQISPKVLAQLKGKSGPAGKDGANGANGTNGINGAQGPVGEKGLAGTPGTPGVGTQGPAGSPWTDKGVLPKGSSETGQWGLSLRSTGIVPAPISVPIPLESGPTPHFIGPGEGEDTGETNKVPSGCKGSSKHPVAEPGNLCVFQTNWATLGLSGEKAKPFKGLEGHEFLNSEASPPWVEPSPFGAGKNGTVLLFEVETATGYFVSGTWVVTS